MIHDGLGEDFDDRELQDWQPTVFHGQEAVKRFVEGNVKTIPIDRLKPTQKLGYKRKQGIPKLMKKVQAQKGTGKKPIKVRKRDDGKYDILDGHHRYIAHKKLGLKTMRAYVKESKFLELLRPGIIESRVQAVMRVLREGGPGSGRKPSVTIMMGGNGVGKSTVLKALANRYDAKEEDVKGNKWSVLSKGGDKALMLGNYNHEDHVNASTYFIKGNFYDKLKDALKGAQEIGAKTVIVDSKRLGFGKAHDKLVDYLKKNGIKAQAVRVRAPVDVMMKRVSARKEKGHITDRSESDLRRQHEKVKDTHENFEGPKLKLSNDEGTSPDRLAGRLGHFIFRDNSTKESREGGPGSGPHPSKGKEGKGYDRKKDAIKELHQRRADGEQVKLMMRGGTYTQPHGKGRGIVSFVEYFVAPGAPTLKKEAGHVRRKTFDRGSKIGQATSRLAFRR